MQPVVFSSRSLALLRARLSFGAMPSASAGSPRRARLTFQASLDMHDAMAGRRRGMVCTPRVLYPSPPEVSPAPLLLRTQLLTAAGPSRMVRVSTGEPSCPAQARAHAAAVIQRPAAAPAPVLPAAHWPLRGPRPVSVATSRFQEEVLARGHPDGGATRRSGGEPPAPAPAPPCRFFLPAAAHVGGNCCSRYICCWSPSKPKSSSMRALIGAYKEVFTGHRSNMHRPRGDRAAPTRRRRRRRR
jgi:hypothetical protein